MGIAFGGARTAFSTTVLARGVKGGHGNSLKKREGLDHAR
jgi:hypothetical protein